MIVDASAILAILLKEGDGDAMEDALLHGANETACMSPINYLEAAVRLDSLKSPNEVAQQLDALLAAFGIDLVHDNAGSSSSRS